MVTVGGVVSPDGGGALVLLTVTVIDAVAVRPPLVAVPLSVYVPLASDVVFHENAFVHEVLVHGVESLPHGVPLNVHVTVPVVPDVQPLTATSAAVVPLAVAPFAGFVKLRVNGAGGGGGVVPPHDAPDGFT